MLTHSLVPVAPPSSSRPVMVASLALRPHAARLSCRPSRLAAHCTSPAVSLIKTIADLDAHSMTSVGATTGVPETSASFSSGGFSNFFGTASYQETVVSAYLAKLGNTNSGKFNRSGRAFPDVSAQGENVEIIFQGEAGLVAGTSCSSPIFASIISLINDRLAAAGKPPLGFLNPFLYGAAASTFTDITTGDNPGCNTNGFPAEAGWDPVCICFRGCQRFAHHLLQVTGLGTPNFAKLLAAAETAAGL